MYAKPDEDGMVYACPRCDRADRVYRRTHSRRDYQHPYRCYDCGAEFDEPVKRESRVGGEGVARPRSDAAQSLLDADPDDVVTDGGVEFTAEGAYYCTNCETRVRRGDYEDPSDALEDAWDCALSHTGKADVRFDPNLDEDDYEPVDDNEVLPDGGEETETEWTLECMDCEWSETVLGTEHPAEGPPSEVEKTVRVHKNTTDESHIVRVTGTHSPDDRAGEFDPSLVTDGGSEGECERCGTLTERTTLTGEFRCESCGRQVAKQHREASREECQDALEEYVTDGGVDVGRNVVIGEISGRATQYTAMLVRLDPDERPGLKSAGFHSPATLYVLFTGGNTFADYNRHRLERKLPGNAEWIHDELQDLQVQLGNGRIETDGGQVLEQDADACPPGHLEEFRREEITPRTTLVIYRCPDCGDREHEFVQESADAGDSR